MTTEIEKTMADMTTTTKLHDDLSGSEGSDKQDLTPEELEALQQEFIEAGKNIDHSSDYFEAQVAEANAEMDAEYEDEAEFKRRKRIRHRIYDDLIERENEDDEYEFD